MNIKRLIKEILFPNRCPFCDKLIDESLNACKSCENKLQRFSITTYAIGSMKCSAPFRYEGMYAGAIKRFKFRKRRNYTKALGCYMVEAMHSVFTPEELARVDLVTCVPMHKKDLNRKRNHSELLGAECASRLNLDYARVIEKVRFNKKQHHLKGSLRYENVKGAFGCPDKELVKGKNILIIDDIITTGATLGECAKVLTKAGCASVICAVFCATVY